MIIGYLSIGSNLGDRKKNLSLALGLIKKYGSINLPKLSSFYETSPLGPKQRKFLNAAVQIKTDLSAIQLLKKLQSIEKRMSRKKTIRWGPRIIDLDIIFYGKKKIRTKDLTIPHPRFHERRFVLEPLKDIAPRFKPPGFNKTIAQMARELKLTDPTQKVRLYGRFTLTPALSHRGRGS